MSYKVGKFSCKDCHKPLTCKATYCMKCVGNHKKKRVDPEERRLRIKEYKKEYFQKNKVQIYERIKSKPVNTKSIRNSWLKRKYGLTESDYQLLLESQDFKCKICQRPHVEAAARSKLVVDHNHKTGNIRGLLCHNCNVTIGLMNEDTDNISKLIDYLKNERCNDSNNSLNRETPEC